VSELVPGVDVGTSSAKGVLARPDGTIVAIDDRVHPPSLPRPATRGRPEPDPG
jgi:xylulokinase